MKESLKEGGVKIQRRKRKSTSKKEKKNQKSHREIVTSTGSVRFVFPLDFVSALIQKTTTSMKPLLPVLVFVVLAGILAVPGHAYFKIEYSRDFNTPIGPEFDARIPGSDYFYFPLAQGGNVRSDNMGGYVSAYRKINNMPYVVESVPSINCILSSGLFVDEANTEDKPLHKLYPQSYVKLVKQPFPSGSVSISHIGLSSTAVEGVPELSDTVVYTSGDDDDSNASYGGVMYTLVASGITAATNSLVSQALRTSITNADDDIRLGACGQTLIDVDTWVVAEFVLTNKGVWAVYGRLPYGRASDGGSGANYRSFVNAKRVATRTSATQRHTLKIIYEKSGAYISWYLENQLVFTVDKFGFPSTDSHAKLLLDLGGTDTLAAPETVQVGWSCVARPELRDPNAATLTSASKGLIRLLPAELAYYTLPTEFATDADSLMENAAYGVLQNGVDTFAQLNIYSIVVTSS